MKIQLPASNENTRVSASLGPQAMSTGDADLCWGGVPWGLMPVLHSALGAQEAGLLVLSHSWVNPVEKSNPPGFFQTSIPAFAEWPDLVTSSCPPAPCGPQPAVQGRGPRGAGAELGSLPVVPVHGDRHPLTLRLHEHLRLDLRGEPARLPHADRGAQHRRGAHAVLLRRGLGHPGHRHR